MIETAVNSCKVNTESNHVQKLPFLTRIFLKVPVTRFILRNTKMLGILKLRTDVKEQHHSILILRIIQDLKFIQKLCHVKLLNIIIR